MRQPVLRARLDVVGERLVDHLDAERGQLALHPRQPDVARGAAAVAVNQDRLDHASSNALRPARRASLPRAAARARSRAATIVPPGSCSSLIGTNSVTCSRRDTTLNAASARIIQTAARDARALDAAPCRPAVDRRLDQRRLHRHGAEQIGDQRLLRSRHVAHPVMRGLGDHRDHVLDFLFDAEVRRRRQIQHHAARSRRDVLHHDRPHQPIGHRRVVALHAHPAGCVSTCAGRSAASQMPRQISSATASYGCLVRGDRRRDRRARAARLYAAGRRPSRDRRSSARSRPMRPDRPARTSGPRDPIETGWTLS